MIPLNILFQVKKFNITKSVSALPRERWRQDWICNNFTNSFPYCFFSKNLMPSLHKR
jgi:hypothetical protein